jgi:hypothetical protein
VSHETNPENWQRVIDRRHEIDNELPDYDRMLADTDNFNKGMTHGIDHAVLVLRSALTRGDLPASTKLNHAGLEALRQDIVALRRHSATLVSFVEELRK